MPLNFNQSLITSIGITSLFKFLSISVLVERNRRILGQWPGYSYNGYCMGLKVNNYIHRFGKQDGGLIKKMVADDRSEE